MLSKCWRLKTQISRTTDFSSTRFSTRHTKFKSLYLKRPHTNTLNPQIFAHGRSRYSTKTSQD